MKAMLPGSFDPPTLGHINLIKRASALFDELHVVVADNIRYHDMFYIEGTVPHKHRTAIGRLHEFLDMIYDDGRFESVFFENGDGMTVSRWKG